MVQRLLSVFEPFVMALLATVLLATFLPVRGSLVPVADIVTAASIVLLFFLHGAKLSREAILDGLRNWRLHLATLGLSFGLFPLLGIGLSALPLFDPPVAAGLLFLTLLPSTVQSSIAFTAIARGNVAAAICSASFSNLLGIVLTPVLVALLMDAGGSSGALSVGSIEKIALQLLLPFLAGHLARPLIGGFVARRKLLVSLADRGSVLLVVYSAFSASVVEGLWERVSAGELAALLLVCCLLLAVALAAAWGAAKALRLPREDAIVLLFCGSKKSLASGVPMAGVLFPTAAVGSVILPVMLFHQVQLIACAMIARRLSRDP